MVTTTTPEPSAPVLAVRDLRVGYQVRGAINEVVHGVDLQVHPGQTLAVVGESGSGKTSIARSVIGLLPTNGRVLGGAIEVNGTDVSGWNQRRMQSVRGERIGLVPQDPSNSLNPVKSVGANLAEVLQIHRWGNKEAIHHRVIELLERVGIPEPERRARQYPHELSGGMRQRVLVASAIALSPDLIIADEPTSALDVTVQKRVLDLLDDLQRDLGTAVLFITHDLAVATDRGDEVAVLKDGYLQEHGPTSSILGNPQSDYTKQLLHDAPAFRTNEAGHRAATGELVSNAGPQDRAIVVSDLVQEFEQGRAEPFRAVDQVGFHVVRATTHALIGESGSGKTTTARAVVGLQRPTAGSIEVEGQEVTELDRSGLRAFRRSTQLVYQNPYGSLDPKQSIGAIIGEPLRNLARAQRPTRAQRRQRVVENLERVALPTSVLGRKPAELSGGQLQRVAIARALVIEPSVLVLDEAVSALDVSVQAQILDLLGRLQSELNLTYLFISHDLAVVRQISDTVSVMRDGKVVEQGRTEEVFSAPQNAYTSALLEAVPGKPSESTVAS